MKIALIAHDEKKAEIIEFAKKYKDVLANYELYATGTDRIYEGKKETLTWQCNNIEEDKVFSEYFIQNTVNY